MFTHSYAVCVTIISNSSIIPPSFKFTEFHTLTLAAHSYALLSQPNNMTSIVTSNETFIKESYLLVQFQIPHRTCHFQQCEESDLLQETVQDARYGKKCMNPIAC